MKIFSTILLFILLVNSCGMEPEKREGPALTQPRNQLTVEQMLGDIILPLIDMSFFARQKWAQRATYPFSGSISTNNIEMIYPTERTFYPGENIFPGIIGFCQQRAGVDPYPKRNPG